SFSRLPLVQTTTSFGIRMRRSNERIVSWTLILTAGDRTAPNTGRSQVHDFERLRFDERLCRCSRRRESSGLVSGADGVRAPGFRRAINFGGCPLTLHAIGA